MAACFATKGFEVVGADRSQSYVDAVNELRAPVFEPGLDALLREAAGKIRATTDTAEAVGAADIVFLVVPTPTDVTGGFSLQYVLEACGDIGRAIEGRRDFPVVVVTSTVMPGSTGGPIREAIEAASGGRAGEDFGLCYGPEFIALGTVIRDFLQPDFLLVGESDPRAGDRLADVYARVVENDAPVARMNFVNAELAKIAVNTYVTTKITFANMLARICERLPEADVDAVTGALGLDSRIGSRYLTGAIAYGGPCFPRDNLALATLARSLDAPARLAEATDEANREEIQRLADLVVGYLPAGGTNAIAVLGLAYKTGTNVVEESPGLLLVHELSKRGFDVAAYDPEALDVARRISDGVPVRFAPTAADALDRAEVVVIATSWPVFADLDLVRVARERGGLVVVDCWRTFDTTALDDPAITHVVLGTGPQAMRSSAVAR